MSPLASSSSFLAASQDIALQRSCAALRRATTPNGADRQLEPNRPQLCRVDRVDLPCHWARVGRAARPSSAGVAARAEGPAHIAAAHVALQPRTMDTRRPAKQVLVPIVLAAFWTARRTQPAGSFLSSCPASLSASSTSTAVSAAASSAAAASPAARLPLSRQPPPLSSCLEQLSQRRCRGAAALE